MNEAYIIDAVRTPRGKRNGSLSLVHAIDLATYPLTSLVSRNKIDAKEIEDVIYGCVSQRKEQDNDIARGAVLAAGLPIEVSGVTLNRFCASGLTACNFAAQSVMSGQIDLTIGGGIEHMSRIPMDIDFYNGDSMLSQRWPNLIPQGLSAEMIAQIYGFSRTQLDELAVRSQQLAGKAQAEGYFNKSLIPVKAKMPDGKEFIFEKDEHLRPSSTVQALAGLKTVFKADGVIHAGNSSGIVDGASGVLIASKKKTHELGLKPRAKFTSMAVAGADPVIMLLGPIPSTQKALKKAGLTIKDIDLFEINEAFAPVVLAVSKELEIPMEKINVNGGAIALGHPLGASGAMLLGTVLDELERRDLRYGLVTLCIGMGMGVTTIIDRKV
ncbi:MAG TPA: acetyl-CoA C-acyltransferase [Deltaproteobacteria bacterium]|nr:acetyl-CoA C-acyltransferase [Deltaproteobacteria bacterium]